MNVCNVPWNHWYDIRAVWLTTQWLHTNGLKISGSVNTEENTSNIFTMVFLLRRVAEPEAMGGPEMSHCFLRVCDVLGWPFRYGRFGLCHFCLSRFGHMTSRSWSLRSRDISVRLWNLAEILYVYFLMQTYLNQRKVLFKKLQTWSKIQYLISMSIWFSLSSASKLDHYRHFQINTKTSNA